MVQINEVVPSRFRVGELVTIKGFGFAPTFGDNSVAFDGIPEPIQSESATEIQVLVPAGITADGYSQIIVFRSDTIDSDAFQAWSKGTLDDIRSGALLIPGQIPGDEERADPSRVEDTPQAQDYERLVAKIQYLLRDVMATAGDVFAFDGASIVPLAVGAAGQRLGANPATATGMEYAAIARATSLAWAGQKASANQALGALVANGDPSNQSVIAGLHLAQATGSVYRIAVLFEGTAGDTLDQVRLRINGITQYDSLVGLGVTPGNAHIATVAVPVVGGVDTIELEAKKLGLNGTARFVGQVGVR